MLQLARLLLLIAVASVSAAGAAFAQQPLKQVYLIQNSGWMEPFYSNPDSPFRTAVEYAINSTAGSSPIVIASFNQNGQVPGEQSPNPLFSGTASPPAVADAVRQKLQLGKKANGAYADTDFAGALIGAITRPDMLAQQPGIIWIFTNNMNSPDNSQDVLDNTLGFYRELQTSSAITRIIAFPVPMKIQGQRYSTSGFILYGIAYGDAAAQALAAYVADGAPIRQAFPAPPGLLKPLDQQAVTLEFDATPVNGISVYSQNGVLFFSGLSAEQPSPVTLTARVRSLQDTLVVEQATVSARWLAGTNERPAPPVTATITPSEITNLGARQLSNPLQITVTFPPVAASGVMDETQHIDGYMEVELSGLRYGLDPAFASNAADVFGGPEMVAESELFNAHKKVTQAATRVPIRMTVEFSPWPLALLAGSVIAGVALLGGAAWWMFAPRARMVMIDGTRMKVRLSSFGSTTVTDGLGRTWRVQGSPFGVKGTLT